MRFRAALLVLALGAAPAFAANCPDQTQTGLNACANDAFKRADDQLNQDYKEITRRLSGDKAKASLLVQSQKSWIAWRDAECEFASSAVVGGSVYPMIHAMCLEAQTRQRDAALQSYLKCPEGDLACPVPAK